MCSQKFWKLLFFFGDTQISSNLKPEFVKWDPGDTLGCHLEIISGLRVTPIGCHLEIISGLRFESDTHMVSPWNNFRFVSDTPPCGRWHFWLNFRGNFRVRVSLFVIGCHFSSKFRGIFRVRVSLFFIGCHFSFKFRGDFSNKGVTCFHRVSLFF